MCDIFKTVVSVLIQEGTPIENINDAISAIHKSYSPEQLTTVKSSLIDFNEIAFQDAYIYLYFTSHVYVIDNLFHIFWENDKIQTWFLQHFRRTTVLNVCAIGGGPGSEIFGLDLFMKKYFGHVDVCGTVLDRHPCWSFMFNDLVNKFGVRNLSGVRYQPFEFFDETSNPATKQAISSADVVFIVKFISAVSCDRSLCENKFSKLLVDLKPNAMIIFVDNAGGDYSKIMETIGDNANLHLTQLISHHIVQVPPPELDDMLSNPTLKSPPQNNTAVRASIWFKRYQNFWQDDNNEIQQNCFINNDLPFNLNNYQPNDAIFNHEPWTKENNRNFHFQNTNFEPQIQYRDIRYKNPLLPLPIFNNPPSLIQQQLPPLPIFDNSPLLIQPQPPLPLLSLPTMPIPEWFTDNDVGLTNYENDFNCNNNSNGMQEFEPLRNGFNAKRNSKPFLKRRIGFNGAGKWCKKEKRVKVLRNIVLKIRYMANKLGVQNGKKISRFRK